MCKAIPRKVLQVADSRIEVLYDGEPRWVANHTIPDLIPGEYVMVYAEQVLERMPAEEAEDIIRFCEELEAMLEEASR